MKVNYFRNKKGIAVEDLVALVFFIIVSTIVIFFFLYSQVISISEDIKKVKFERDSLEKGNEFLIYYINSPIENKIMADIIAESIATEDKTLLKTKTDEIYNKYLPEGERNLMIMGDSGKEFLKKEGPFRASAIIKLGGKKAKPAYISLPQPKIQGEYQFYKITLD